MCCHIDPEKMAGMSLDRASSKKNLAKLIKSEVAPQALYVQCFAHCNELVCKDAMAISPMTACAQDLCEDLYVLVGISPKRILIFEDIQKYIDEDASVIRLKNLSKIQWTARGPASDVIIKKHDAFQETLHS